jgi:hypothetical protein
MRVNIGSRQYELWFRHVADTENPRRGLTTATLAEATVASARFKDEARVIATGYVRWPVRARKREKDRRRMAALNRLTRKLARAGWASWERRAVWVAYFNRAERPVVVAMPPVWREQETPPPLEQLERVTAAAMARLGVGI